jgi:hypothetical protein
MTLGEIRPFFASKIAALDLKEWPDGFNYANIPSNVLNKMFHVELGQVSANTFEQQCHSFRMPLTIRVFFKGYGSPQTAKDTAMTKANEILNALLKPSMRLTEGTNLKDIRPVTVRPVPLADSNDNSLILELVFEVNLIYRFS